MDGGKPAGDLFHDVDGFRNLKLALPLEDLMKAFALNKLHRDKSDCPCFSKIEDTNDIPVGDLTCKDQFVLESLQNFGIAGQLRPNNLECYFALQLEVLRFVNSAHTPFPED